MSKKKFCAGIFLILSILLSGCSSSTNAGQKAPVQVDSKNINYKNNIIEVDLKIPVISQTHDASIEESINKTLENELTGFKNEIENTAKEDYEFSKQDPDVPYHTHCAVSRFEVKYNKNGLLSVPVTLYSYTGGAHGMTVMVPYNFDINTGNRIELKDLFKKDCDYKKVLIDEITRQMKENKDALYFDDAIEVVNKLEGNHPYYIADDGIVVYFGLYEIAPYAAGIQEFKIPYQVLKDCLKITL